MNKAPQRLCNQWLKFAKNRSGKLYLHQLVHDSKTQVNYSSQLLLLIPRFGVYESYSDWSKWFGTSTLPSICNLNFSFIGEVGKK